MFLATLALQLEGQLCTIREGVQKKYIFFGRSDPVNPDNDDDEYDDFNYDDVKGDDDNWWYCGNCGPEWLFDPKCQLWRGQNGTETLHPQKHDDENENSGMMIVLPQVC